ncbi:hypothetical protein [Epibacterium ulvae]|uniref:hypothetical protein n=1 Tax=Epibacterium ulvae TaxID=1156985 RepID=UPI003CD0CBA4
MAVLQNALALHKGVHNRCMGGVRTVPGVFALIGTPSAGRCLTFVMSPFHIETMKQIFFTCLLMCSTASMVRAEEPPSLIEQGLELFMQGLQDEMSPALETMQDLLEQVGPSLGAFLAEMGPALADIASEIEDWSAYELPEILPNGDIIIRKKPTEDADEPRPDGEIEL